MLVSRGFSLGLGAAALALLLAPPLRASPGDDDEEARPVEGPVAPPRPAGKPVPFDRGWLEPFFKHGPAKQGGDAFRSEDWAAAEAAFAKAVRALPRGSEERLAATYMLAIARANQSEWADAGKLF